MSCSTSAMRPQASTLPLETRWAQRSVLVHARNRFMPLSLDPSFSGFLPPSRSLSSCQAGARVAPRTHDFVGLTSKTLGAMMLQGLDNGKRGKFLNTAVQTMGASDLGFTLASQKRSSRVSHS